MAKCVRLLLMHELWSPRKGHLRRNVLLATLPSLPFIELTVVTGPRY